MNLKIEVINAEIEPAAAARHVLTAIKPISEVPVVVLPELNPNHPNHKINTPKAANVNECPGIAFAFPLPSNFPILGPTIIAPANAVHPP